jgi:uncharacterized protein (TIRG00374 family)
MTRRWQTLAGFAVSALLLWWALRDVHPGLLWEELRGAHLGVLALAAAVQTCGFALRAARWGVILRPVHAGVPYRPRFAATCVGFMANNLLPARVGELARALALARLARVPLSASLGSLVVERLLDAVVLATFVSLPLLVPRLAGTAGLAPTVRGVLAVAGPAFAAAAGGLALVVWRPEWIARAVRAVVGRVATRALGDRLAKAAVAFAHGLGVLRRPRLLLATLAWSVAHWLWTGIGFYLGMLAFDIREPGYLGALFLQGVNAFAVAVPSAPGFFGPFEASVRVALAPFGVAPAKQVGYALGLHIAGFVPVTLLGLYYVARLGLSWREVGHSEELVAAAGAADPPGGVRDG